MIDSPAEIVRSYRMAADPKKQIKVLAELNACSVKEIRQVLVGEGVLPRETEVPEEPRKAVKKRFDEETAGMLYEEGLDDAAIAKATGMTAHTVAKWRSRNGLRKKVRKPRMKKNVDVPGMKPPEAAPGVQNTPHRRGGGRGNRAGLYKERRAGATDSDGGGAARPAGGRLPGRPRGVRGARGGDRVRGPLARRAQHTAYLRERRADRGAEGNGKECVTGRGA